MNEDSNNPKITVDTASGTVNIELFTDFGKINFNYTPESIASGLAALVADILERDQTGVRQNDGIESLELPQELVKQAALIYDQRSRQKFPNDSIERFSPGSRAYARGVVEQFSDNLVPALMLMLNYLAAITLIHGGSDSKRVTPDAARERQATIELLQDRLRKGVQRIVSG